MILPDVEATIEMMMRQDKPSIVVIDANGVGLGVAQALTRKFGNHVLGSTRSDQASKIERFGVAMSNTYGGRILLPVKAPFMEAWLYEMVGFPDGEYDDQVDSYTQVAGHMPTVIMRARQNAR
jgi:predicted phage terminase large subunit-like protein